MRVNGERALEVSPLCALSTLALWQGDDAHALGAGARGSGNRCRGSRARPGGRSLVPGGRRRAGARAAMPRRRRPSHLRMRAPARLPARIGTTPSAGLARVALAQGDTAAAMQALEPLLALGAKTSADDNPLEGVEFPRLVEWTCHRVLASRGRPARRRVAGPRARGACRPRRRPSPTPSFAKGSFATSRFTARSRRRGLERNGFSTAARRSSRPAPSSPRCEPNEIVELGVLHLVAERVRDPESDAAASVIHHEKRSAFQIARQRARRVGVEAGARCRRDSARSSASNR